MKKKVEFKTARFLASAFTKEQLPASQGLPEIAFIGRSNVGKSSLINHLLNQKKLAKTSSRPGKTQSINFFLIDELLLLVDLPGYGYAKTAKEKRKEWGELIQDYLQERQEVQLLLILLDIRREPNEEDKALIEWALYHKKPFLLLFTKSDQLKAHEIDKAMLENLKALGLASPAFLSYSIKSARAKIDLIRKINQMLQNGTSS